MEYFNGKFYLFFSAFYKDRGKIRSHVVEVSTQDWIKYSEPILHIDGTEDGWTGLCSPNISKIGENYILTINSWGEKHPNGRTNNLFYTTSRDLEKWDHPKQVAKNLTENERVIDIAFAHENNKYYLIYKQRIRGKVGWKDFPRISTAKSLDDEFEFIGDGFVKLFRKNGRESKKPHENYQFLKIDGIWYLLTTSYRPHRPYLYRMAGDGKGKNDSDWLIWEEGYELLVKEENFNTFDRSNAGFLADWRDYDDYFYLIYAGTTEDLSFARRGNNKLGLSKSKDLVNFECP